MGVSYFKLTARFDTTTELCMHTTRDSFTFFIKSVILNHFVTVKSSLSRLTAIVIPHLSPDLHQLCLKEWSSLA